MINNYANFVKYTGLGNTSKYSFPFKITNTNQIRILVFNTLTDELVVSQLADAGGFVASATFNINKAGGEITLASNLPLDRELIIKLSMNEGVQPYQYREQDDFRLRHFENGLDHVLLHIQRLYEKFTRVLGFDEKLSYKETFNPTLDTPVEILPKSYMRTKVDGTGVELREFYGDVVEVVREFIADGGGGVPLGGETYSILEKKSDDDGDADWTDPLVLNGYTTRYNQIINLQGIKAILAYVFQMGYAPPTVSLTGSVSSAAREKGNTISATTLTAAIGKIIDDISQVRFYQGVTLLDTQNSGGAIPNGGNSTYDYGTPFSDTTTFSVQVDDASAQPKPSASASITYPFFFAYLYGKGAAALTAAQVYALTKVIADPPSPVSISYSLAVGEKPYFAYPATFADLTSIKNINNLETIGSWTKRTENITNAYGETTSYKIYEFNNLAGAANSNTYTFIR